MKCIINGQFGIYVPQHFAESFDLSQWQGINSGDVEILLAGPDHAEYWDAWDAVLSSAKFTDADGEVWTLYQDSDLFVVNSRFDWETL